MSDLESECAALRAEVERLRAALAAEEKAAAAMVKGARDIAEFHLRNSDAEYDRRVAADSRLAAATELVRTGPGMPGFTGHGRTWPQWCDDAHAFLAARPAAPSLGHPGADEVFARLQAARAEAPARTEAEQRVAEVTE